MSRRGNCRGIAFAAAGEWKGSGRGRNRTWTVAVVDIAGAGVVNRNTRSIDSVIEAVAAAVRTRWGTVERTADCTEVAGTVAAEMARRRVLPLGFGGSAPRRG